MNKTRIPDSPPVINPVNPDSIRPLWSVMIPTYNCIAYLEHTLNSVLLQDRGIENMQIEVIDDCSTDGDVETLVQRIGKGRVKFYRQSQNGGSLRNFETCLNRSKGRLVHLLHGDDLVKDGFYSEIESLFDCHPEIGAAFTANDYIDDRGSVTDPKTLISDQSGILSDFQWRIAQKAMLQVVSMVVRREVYEKLGGFYAVHYGEDWEMWNRIAASYQVAYSPKTLAIYRGGEGHNTSITSNSFRTGQNLRDIQKVIEIVKNYLPEKKRGYLNRQARKNFSMHYAKASNNIYHQNRQAAFVQARGALQMDLNFKTIFWVSRLCITHLNHLLFKGKK